MLTGGERRLKIGVGLFGLAAILIFVVTAASALVAWKGADTGAAAETPLLTAYTWRILQFTLWQAALSTLLSILFALPAALALARRPGFPGRIWIIRLMALPMGLPTLIGALGLIGIWGRQGVMNGLLQKLGLGEPVSIYGLSGILLAHVFFNLPLAVRLLLPAIERLPAEYWLISSGLGMRPVSIFRFIEWPALRRVLPGITGLIFMLCATSFTLVLILGGGPAATTLEVAIYQALRFDFDPPKAVGLATLQIAVTAIILALLALFPPPQDGEQTEGRVLRRFDGRTAAALVWDGAVIGLTTVFIALPLGSILVSGVKADLLKLVTSAVFLQALRTSFAIAAMAAAVTLGLSLAFIHARAAVAEMRRPTRLAKAFAALLGSVSALVLLVPPVVLGTGWFLALRPLGEVARFAPLLVALINALMALPFVMRVLAPAIETHRARTSRLSTSLGISGLNRLLRIDLPILLKPLMTAFSFAFALSIGDLGAVALFGSNDLATLPWLIYSRLGSYRSNDADGLALLLALICLVLAAFGTWGQGVKREARHGG